MANLSGFNANSITPATSYEAIPAGSYTAMITESEMKATKAGTGEYLQITLQIIDGEHSGRKLWDRLNLNNPNATAVEIAQRTLSAICHAVDVLEPQDSLDLHDIPLVVKVGVEQDKQDGSMRNVIKGYSASSGAAPRAAAPTRAATPPPPPPAAKKPAAPWATR